MHGAEEPRLEMRFHISLNNDNIFQRIFHFIELARLCVSDMTAGSGFLSLSITENITSQ